MNAIRKVAVIAGGLVLASLSSAQQVTGGINFSGADPSGDTYYSPWYYMCSAEADSNHPSASSSLSYTEQLTFICTVPTGTPPPTSVTASFQETISGSYSYVIFGSTTPKGAVSANYSAVADLGTAYIQDSSGTINQTGTEQEKDSTPQTATGGYSTRTVSTPTSGWSSVNNGNNTTTWTFIWVSNDVSGSASATATGWTPPPPPPGQQSPTLADFNAQGQWFDNLNNYTVNNQVQYQSDNPGPSTGGGASGGGGSSLSLTPWVLKLLGFPCYR